MYKYDIVEYSGFYFVRRRLFGLFFEKFYRSVTDGWYTKEDIVGKIEMGFIRHYHKDTLIDQPQSLENVTESYEHHSGIRNIKIKAKAKVARFNVYGS